MNIDMQSPEIQKLKRENPMLNIEENTTIIGFTIKIGIVMFVIMEKIID